MRIACLQYAPVLGDVTGNIARADCILDEAEGTTDLDLLMLPELAFTGYDFQSRHSIEPFLETTTAGPSTTWAQSAACRLHCHVSVGYPEKTTAAPPVYYNSVVLVAPTGDVVAHYRKRFLYYTDEPWAAEGDEAFSTRRVAGLGDGEGVDVAMGICM